MAAAAQEVVGEILRIAIADITAGDRLRPVDPVWAAALGAVMAAEGQKTPIEVCRLPGKKGFHLVAGGHRLEGAHLEGSTHILAIVGDADALERREREISENLWRKGLSPIDRAACVAELIEVRKVRAGVGGDATAPQIAAKARWSQALKEDAGDASANIAHAYGWADGVADQVGLSRRSIYNDLALHRRLLPDVAERVRGMPIGANAGQLRALAKLPEAEQRRAVELIASGKAKNTAGALAVIHKKRRPADLDPQDVFWGRHGALWARMSAATKRRALDEIARDPSLPPDLKALLAPLLAANIIKGEVA